MKDKEKTEEIKEILNDLINRIDSAVAKEQKWRERVGRNCSTCKYKGGHGCSNLFCDIMPRECIDNGHRDWEARPIKKPDITLTAETFMELAETYINIKGR